MESRFWEAQPGRSFVGRLATGSDLVEEMEAEGLLPAFPDEETSDPDVAEWVGAAQSVGFAARVLQTIADEAE